MLDQIFMTLSDYYHEPQILAPLDSDPDSNGKPSEHNIVFVNPIFAINNKVARTTSEIRFWPVTESGLENMKTWRIQENWSDIWIADNEDEKASIFQ